MIINVRGVMYRFCRWLLCDMGMHWWQECKKFRWWSVACLWPASGKTERRRLQGRNRQRSSSVRWVVAAAALRSVHSVCLCLASQFLIGWILRIVLSVETAVAHQLHWDENRGRQLLCQHETQGTDRLCIVETRALKLMFSYVRGGSLAFFCWSQTVTRRVIRVCLPAVDWASNDQDCQVRREMSLSGIRIWTMLKLFSVLN